MSVPTPGPWTIEDCREMCDGEFWIMAQHPDVSEVSIAAVRAGCDEADEIGDNAANAHLIAAAPDLFAACRAAIAYDAAIASCGNDPNKMSSHCSAEGDDLDSLYSAWIDAARAAIAKATQ